MALKWIASVEPSGSTDTVEFTNIPQTYMGLIIKAHVKGGAQNAYVVGSAIIKLNGTTLSSSNSAGGYTMRNYPSTMNSYGPNYGVFWTGNNNAWSTSEMSIFGYAGTNKKQILSFGGPEVNSNANVDSFLIGSSSGKITFGAVTSITLVNDTGYSNWSSASRIDLYGYKD
jgi:hypothetical protein